MKVDLHRLRVLDGQRVVDIRPVVIALSVHLPVHVHPDRRMLNRRRQVIEVVELDRKRRIVAAEGRRHVQLERTDDRTCAGTAERKLDGEVRSCHRHADGDQAFVPGDEILQAVARSVLYLGAVVDLRRGTGVPGQMQHVDTVRACERRELIDRRTVGVLERRVRNERSRRAAGTPGERDAPASDTRAVAQKC